MAAQSGAVALIIGFIETKDAAEFGEELDNLIFKMDEELYEKPPIPVLLIPD